MPYSPEYRAAGTDENFLDALAKRTGGRLIRDPEQAFVHDLPAVGAPRPLWPYVAGTGSAACSSSTLASGACGSPDLRCGPRYYAVRRRLGYVDEPPLAHRPVIVQSPAGLAMVSPALDESTHRAKLRRHSP